MVMIIMYSINIEEKIDSNTHFLRTPANCNNCTLSLRSQEPEVDIVTEMHLTYGRNISSIQLFVTEILIVWIEHKLA